MAEAALMVQNWDYYLTIVSTISTYINLKCVVCLSGLVWSVPIEFPRMCISVNPRNCTYAFPRLCISVNPRKSVVITYELPRRRFSVNPHNIST
jgi:hypothetical protein